MSHDGRSTTLIRSSILLQEEASYHPRSFNLDDNSDGDRGRESSANNHKSPYQKVQTLSFQIYTGGAPAFISDEVTGERRHNPECIGCK